MDIPECKKLKDAYSECSKDLVSQFWKDFNVKNFFACDGLFQVWDSLHPLNSGLLLLLHTQKSFYVYCFTVLNAFVEESTDLFTE